MYTLQESARAQRSKMTIRVYENALPEDALYIRTVVFVEEQGFRDEFDEIDKNCLHLIAYDDDKQVVELIVRKHYTQFLPRVEVKLTEV